MSSARRCLRSFINFFFLILEPGYFYELLPLRRTSRGYKSVRSYRDWYNDSNDFEMAVVDASTAGLDVFVGAHARSGHGSSGAGAIPEMRVLPFDLDAKDLDPQGAGDWRRGMPLAGAKIKSLVGTDLEPEVSWRTGRGYQGLYLLDKAIPASDYAIYQDLVARLALKLGGDLSMTRLHQPIRVPGTLNRKETPHLKTGLVRSPIVNRAHTVADLDALLSPLPKQLKQPARRPVVLPKEVDADLAECIEALGTGFTVKMVGGTVQCIVLEDCPACNGGRSREEDKAHIAPISGALRCKRASCPAHEGNANSGMPFNEWAPRYASSAHQAIQRRMGSWFCPPQAAAAVSAQVGRKCVASVIEDLFSENSDD